MKTASTPLPEPADSAPVHVHSHGDSHDHAGEHAHSHSDTIDRIGALVAFACAIHCVLVPVVLAIPALGLSWFADPAIENALAGSALLIAAASGAWGFRKHHRWSVIGLFSVAGVLLIASRFLHDAGLIGSALAVVGGLILVGTHIYSHRLICSCTHDADDE